MTDQSSLNGAPAKFGRPPALRRHSVVGSHHLRGTIDFPLKPGFALSNPWGIAWGRN